MATNGDAGESPAALDVGTRIVMLLGGALPALALVGINSVLPAIDSALAHGPADSLLVKQLSGGVLLAMAVGSLIAAFLAQRAGLRRILPIAVLLYVVSGTAGLYLGDLRLLLASRILLGLAASTIQVTALVLINTRLDGTARARWMGLHISIALASTILLQPVAGLMGDFGWRWPFALYGLGLLMLPSVLRHSGIAAVASSTEPRPTRESAEMPGRFWAHFPFHYILLALLVGSIVYLPNIYAPFLLRQHGISNPSTIALILTADSIIGAVMALQYGQLRKRVSRYGAFAFSFAMTGSGALISGFSPGVIGIVIGMLVYGFGVGWFVPNLLTALGEKLEPERQARGLGLVKSAHFLSSPVALLAMEPVARLYGPRTALLAVGALSLVLLVAVIIRSRMAAAQASGKQ